MVNSGTSIASLTGSAELNHSWIGFNFNLVTIAHSEITIKAFNQCLQRDKMISWKTSDWYGHVNNRTRHENDFSSKMNYGQKKNNITFNNITLNKSNQCCSYLSKGLVWGLWVNLICEKFILVSVIQKNSNLKWTWRWLRWLKCNCTFQICKNM